MYCRWSISNWITSSLINCGSFKNIIRHCETVTVFLIFLPHKKTKPTVSWFYRNGIFQILENFGVRLPPRKRTSFSVFCDTYAIRTYHKPETIPYENSSSFLVYSSRSIMLLIIHRTNKPIVRFVCCYLKVQLPTGPVHTEGQETRSSNIYRNPRVPIFQPGAIIIENLGSVILHFQS